MAEENNLTRYRFSDIFSIYQCFEDELRRGEWIISGRGEGRRKGGKGGYIHETSLMRMHTVKTNQLISRHCYNSLDIYGKILADKSSLLPC